MKETKNYFLKYFDDSSDKTIRRYINALDRTFKNVYNVSPKFDFLHFKMIDSNTLLDKVVSQHEKSLDNRMLNFTLKDPREQKKSDLVEAKLYVQIYFSAIPRARGNPHDSEANKNNIKFLKFFIETYVADLFFYEKNYLDVYGRPSIIYIDHKCHLKMNSLLFKQCKGISKIATFKNALLIAFSKRNEPGIIDINTDNIKKFISNCDGYLVKLWGEEKFNQYLKPFNISLDEWLT